MVYWLLSLPLLNKRKDATWEVLQEKSSGMSTNFKLEVPELRVGTLDTLMAISDELSKTANMMDAVVNKIRRQVTEFAGPAGVAGLKVGGSTTESYVTHFKWDEQKYTARKPLRDIIDKVTDTVARIEDDLKVKLSEYNTMKSQLSAAVRKSQGSIAVRDLTTMVQPGQITDTENLATLFVVVSKFAIKEWEGCYETLCKYVVPRSSKVIAEDNDYALASVVLFKRVVDDFKHAARSKGYQVREYVPPAEGSELTAAAADQLKKDTEERKNQLEIWCKTAYGEAFSCLMHVAVVRLFVESILRYGLPPAFQAAVVRPVEKQETKLRDALLHTFADGKAQYWKDDGVAGPGAGLVSDTDSYPYVSFSINIDSL